MYSRRLRLKGTPGCSGRGKVGARRAAPRRAGIEVDAQRNAVCSSSRHIRERWRRLRRITESGPFQRAPRRQEARQVRGGCSFSLSRARERSTWRGKRRARPTGAKLKPSRAESRGKIAFSCEFRAKVVSGRVHLAE